MTQLPAYTLDDQTQVDLNSVGRSEHASCNQCQLIAANRPKLVLWAPPAGGGDKVMPNLKKKEARRKS